MEAKILQTEERGSTLIITINRPEALNALNSAFFKEFNELLDGLEKESRCRVLIITGTGKAFVAGADISEMVSMNQDEGRDFSVTGQKAFERLENLSIPVIAAVNGFALGGGCELAMACDIRIASTKAKFGQPEVNLGLIPGYAGTQRLSRLIGLGNAMYLLMTADTITADEAYRIGLVQQLTEPETLLEKALETAEKISNKGPNAIRKVKYVTRLGLLSDFSKGCDLEADEFSTLFENEGEEGMKAFLEKRKPNWQ